MNTQAQNFANAGLWSQKAFAQASSGPDVPVPPDGPLVPGSAPATLPPLPDGVSFDPGGTGSVRFAASLKPDRAHVWAGAVPSLQPGLKPYAYVVYNTVTADREEQFGWFSPSANDVIASPNILTGGMTYAASSAKTGEDVIPAHYATVEQALAYLAKSGN